VRIKSIFCDYEVFLCDVVAAGIMAFVLGNSGLKVQHGKSLGKDGRQHAVVVRFWSSTLIHSIHCYKQAMPYHLNVTILSAVRLLSY
jgi:hypothetical protein